MLYNSFFYFPSYTYNVRYFHKLLQCMLNLIPSSYSWCAASFCFVLTLKFSLNNIYIRVCIYMYNCIRYIRLWRGRVEVYLRAGENEKGYKSCSSWCRHQYDHRYKRAWMGKYVKMMRWGKKDESVWWKMKEKRCRRCARGEIKIKRQIIYVY